MEMVVALGIMAIVMSFAGVIFRVSTDSHRLALANAEIMQKLRAITEQLDADFRGLRKDGEILVFWRAERKANYTGTNRNAEEAFDRFDRIMFFADGRLSDLSGQSGGGNMADILRSGERPLDQSGRAEPAPDAEARTAHPGANGAHSCGAVRRAGPL
jgi:type II secretory pathway pseudopilin PulG